MDDQSATGVIAKSNASQVPFSLRVLPALDVDRELVRVKERRHKLLAILALRVEVELPLR
jgi:hypothetical protein